MVEARLGPIGRDLGYLFGFMTLYSLLFGAELALGDIPCWRGLASGLAAIIFARRITAPTQLWLPLLLLLLAWPWEHQLAPTLDPILQLLTAWWAAPLAQATGIEVALHGGVDPILAIEGLQIHVTAQCAGFQPIIATSSLGLIFAALVSPNNQKRVMLALSIPVLAYLVNVIRIVLSVHAASIWIDTAGAWDIAHDVIGYLCFGLFYVGLFSLAHILRAPTNTTKSAAI